MTLTGFDDIDKAFLWTMVVFISGMWPDKDYGTDNDIDKVFL